MNCPAVRSLYLLSRVWTAQQFEHYISRPRYELPSSSSTIYLAQGMNCPAVRALYLSSKVWTAQQFEHYISRPRYELPSSSSTISLVQGMNCPAVRALYLSSKVWTAQQFEHYISRPRYELPPIFLDNVIPLVQLGKETEKWSKVPQKETSKGARGRQSNFFFVDGYFT